MNARFLSCGDAAFSVEFAPAIDPVANARVMGLHGAIKAEKAAGRLAGVTETVPSFRSLLVHYDPLTVTRAELLPKIERLVADGRTAESAGRRWLIPCCYDDAEFAPDLPDVAERTGHTVEQVIDIHLSATFDVYAIGFMPGYPYMGGLPKALELPRRSSPRVRVPKSSVAIAGTMGGIYAWDSPGGWHLIGRTPVHMFDPRREEPSLLGPGDKLRHRRIGRAEYDALLARQLAGTLDVRDLADAPAEGRRA